ncbi:DUF3889 domain-containing protein [Oceanobacillus zhaokaii]|nr:DUF3889 domain-containing protein [Oceanobacillus zhaokaii]
MYPNYPFMQNGNQYAGNQYVPYSYYKYQQTYPAYREDRQQAVRGQATWTYGGQVTQCGIHWSINEYMTAAVGRNSPYRCGQTLKIKNLSSATPREILVTVVDQVVSYPANKINLQRRAFEALGANPDAGIIEIEITPSPKLEEEKWGKYLLEVAQAAYPGYKVTEYKTIEKVNLSGKQRKEVYEFLLDSPQGKLKIRGNVIYNPATDRVISFDLKEV